MKKIYFKLLTLAFVIVSMNTLKAQGFSVGAPAADYTLTCLNPVITMTANSGNTPYSYTWTVPGSTINGIYANINLPGTWTVTGQNQTTSVTTTQTFVIASNMQTPTIVVTPTIMNITCTASPGYFTLTSNLSPNATTTWYTMIGNNKVYVGVPQGTINIWSFGNPGIYWAESIYDLTGCAATKSILVTASTGVPAFTVTSPTNFTLGCLSKSITSMQVSMVVTSPVPNSPVNYTFVPPPAMTTPTTFTVNPNLNNITVPGLYGVYVKDLTNNCTSSMSIMVRQNTVQPSTYYIQPLSIMTCASASMVLTAVSNNSNTVTTWTVPPTASVNPTPSQTVFISPAITNATTMITSLGSFTVGASDNNNFCVSAKTVQVIQDIRKPVFTITALSNSVISCTYTDVVIVPVITPTLAASLVPTYVWYTPPSGPGLPGTQLNTSTPGTHTSISASSANGCTFAATYNVAADLTPPAISSSTLGSGCPFTGQQTVTAVTGPTTNITYTWTGAGLTGPVNSPIATATALGNYTCTATNTVNGCTNTVVVYIVCNTGLSTISSTNDLIGIYPNPSKGTITIELSTLTSEMKMSIYDTQGKLLSEKPLNSKINRIETDLPKGCYFYRITSGNEVVKRDKLLIE